MDLSKSTMDLSKSRLAQARAGKRRPSPTPTTPRKSKRVVAEPELENENAVPNDFFDSGSENGVDEFSGQFANASGQGQKVEKKRPANVKKGSNATFLNNNAEKINLGSTTDRPLPTLSIHLGGNYFIETG